MNKVELDQIIKDMNEGLEEDEEEIFLLDLRTYSKDEINYVVDRLNLDDHTREQVRTSQINSMKKHQVRKKNLLRDEKLRAVHKNLNKQSEEVNSLSDRSKMIDTVVASINQLIHDPEINVIQPIDDIDISEALYVFFEKTYFTPDEINSTIDKLELANKENLRETIRKREIEEEPRRKIKFLKEERIQKINEMVQQSMTSRTFTEVAESLKKMYSELPYKVNEADLSEDIEFVIENFKMKPNDIGSFVDLFDLSPDTRNKIKESQKKRIEGMKAIRDTELSIKIERLRMRRPFTLIQDITSVLREQMNDPVIPLAQHEVVSILEENLDIPHSTTIEGTSRRVLPLRQNEYREIIHNLGLSVENVNERWQFNRHAVELLTNYAEFNMLQYPQTDLVHGNPQELSNLELYKREFRELVNESVGKVGTKAEDKLGFQAEFSNLTPGQQEQVMKKVEDFKKRRQENWKQLDVEKLSPLKNRTEKFNAARTRSTNISEKKGQKSSRDHQR